MELQKKVMTPTLFACLKDLHVGGDDSAADSGANTNALAMTLTGTVATMVPLEQDVLLDLFVGWGALAMVGKTLTLFSFPRSFQFNVPSEGISAQTYFGFGRRSPYEGQWDIGSSFELDTDGDQFLIYCLTEDSVPNFLWGFNYKGQWSEAGLQEYGTDRSALPASLADLGGLSLKHRDNCLYSGGLEGNKTELQTRFMDSNQWFCSDDMRFDEFEGDSAPAADSASYTILLTTWVYTTTVFFLLG